MKALLSPAEFVARAIALPWVRWRSDWLAVDCWGLVVLFFREVRGIDLGPVPQVAIAEGFAAARDWAECPRDAGAVAFMAFRDGAATHCGVLLPGDMLLHAEGDETRGGRVKVTRLAAMQRLFPDLRFYRYLPC